MAIDHLAERRKVSATDFSRVHSITTLCTGLHITRHYVTHKFYHITKSYFTLQNFDGAKPYHWASSGCRLCLA